MRDIKIAMRVAGDGAKARKNQRDEGTTRGEIANGRKRRTARTCGGKLSLISSCRDAERS